jgi:hypothetical protein
MGKFGEGNFAVEYRMDSNTRTELFFNRLKHRNSMLKAKYVLSSLPFSRVPLKYFCYR